MKIHKRIGQLLDLYLFGIDEEKRKYVANFLREVNKEIRELAMFSNDKEKAMEYIKLYQDIEGIANAIEHREHMLLMNKAVGDLSHRMVERYLSDNEQIGRA